MRKPVILITGANGEMGHGLIHGLSKSSKTDILALDLEPLSKSIKDHVLGGIQGDILDIKLLEMLNTEYEIKEIYHLAALLSTRAEFSPLIAHDVNVNGTLNLLNLAMDQAQSQGEKVKFFFPSSIAVYGISSTEEKAKAGAIMETEYLSPQTMYGCNKLYCEQLGTYFSNHYQQLSATYSPGLLDFRAIRFPGLISAITMPTGGTSDFIPEMLHNAVQGFTYSSFVNSHTGIPFMTMPDGIKAILELMSAPQEKLSRNVYHITAFAPTAGEFKSKVESYFQDAKIGYEINEKRQHIVDSWPADVNDSMARNDWNWCPEHDLETALETYLIQGVKEFYNL
jgi:threonine 3-dehydrogenase